MTIATINPATGELLKTFEPHSDSEVEGRLRLAAEAFRAHSLREFVNVKTVWVQGWRFAEGINHSQAVGSFGG